MREIGRGEMMWHFDINYWYTKNNGICPNCKVDMTKFHPAQNIYPHFTGACLAGTQRAPIANPLLKKEKNADN
jgi:hypothetical protein